MVRTKPAVYAAVTGAIEAARAKHPGLITIVDLLDGLCYEPANGAPKAVYARNPELLGEVPEGRWFLGGSWLRETPHMQLNAARMYVVLRGGERVVAFELPPSVVDPEQYKNCALDSPEILETIDLQASGLANLVNSGSVEMDRSGARFAVIA